MEKLQYPGCCTLHQFAPEIRWPRNFWNEFGRIIIYGWSEDGIRESIVDVDEIVKLAIEIGFDIEELLQVTAGDDDLKELVEQQSAQR